MRAKEYLEMIRKLDELINRKIRQADNWKKMAYSINVDPRKESYDPNRASSANRNVIVMFRNVSRSVNRQ